MVLYPQHDSRRPPQNCMCILTTLPRQPPRPRKFVQTWPWSLRTLSCSDIWSPYPSSPNLPPVCTFTKMAPVRAYTTHHANHTVYERLDTWAVCASTFCKKNHDDPRSGCRDIIFFVHFWGTLSQILRQKNDHQNRCRQATAVQTPVKIDGGLDDMYAHMLTRARQV